MRFVYFVFYIKNTHLFEYFSYLNFVYLRILLNFYFNPEMPNNIVIRVQSPDGTKRIAITASDNTNNLFQSVNETFELNTFNFALYKEPNRHGEILSSRSKTLSSYRIKHGDMLYLQPLNGASGSKVDSDISCDSSLSSLYLSDDEVDLLLQKLDGRIERPMDDKYCRHGVNSKCIHCSSLEPYDEKYLHDQKIKHLSFHSYLRKLRGGVDKGKFVALENISCKIKPGCTAHPPWPKGICSKCQPNAVTLNRQVYRHLDNVMFENPQLVERFLNYWRTTGHQRIGFLYGSYELHKDVPLGIKAVVAAIYEPPQVSTRDTINLLQDDKIDSVNSVAKQLGLQMVGWIFTDLVADDVSKGTVKHYRNGASHFLSAQEVIMAGYFQNQHPNPCRLSPTGYFGSKFVTVCVTGDSQNQVHMEGYQVSNQCMALVRDNCLIPTRDAPELGYIRESTNEQYVPDVFFKEKDEYGNEVTQLARPLPIEYLLVDVPVSTPMEPLFTFVSNPSIKPFPVENRMLDGHIQDFPSLVSYLQQFTPDRFLEAASDFHFLIYIATMDMLPLKEFMSPLLEAVKTKDAVLVREWSKSENWATVEHLMAAQGMTASSATSSTNEFTSVASLWTCAHCTFLNQPDRSVCEMCSLPR